MEKYTKKLRDLADHIDDSRGRGRFDWPTSDKLSIVFAPELDFGIVARKIYDSRRRREDIFNIPGLFGDPAWDMLIDLVINENRLSRVSVSSACIAACVPPTTALRWLGTLEECGLVVRVQDSIDARRTFVELTQKGRNLTCEALRAGIHANRAGTSTPLLLAV